MTKRMTDERLAEIELDRDKIEKRNWQALYAKELLLAPKAERAFLLNKLDTYLAMEVKLARVDELLNSANYENDVFTVARIRRTLNASKGKDE